MIKLTSFVTGLPIYVRFYEILAIGAVPASDERAASTEVFLSRPESNGAVFVVTESAEAIVELLRAEEKKFESA